jgi:hypothetical protein
VRVPLLRVGFSEAAGAVVPAGMERRGGGGRGALGSGVGEKKERRDLIWGKERARGRRLGRPHLTVSEAYSVRVRLRCVLT